MWKQVFSSLKSFKGKVVFGQVKISEDDKLKAHIRNVVRDNFGVYVNPVYNEGITAFSMKLLPDTVIDEIPEEHHLSFITSVNDLSRCVYKYFAIDELLQTFHSRPYDISVAYEIKDIIECYIAMHENMVGKKMYEALAEGIINYIDSKCVV